ncbi:protein of unknown function [Hyphomicrobium sp. MC1]|nr:protein of unknown function [Hyphomicrobium sp. MC1]
MIGLREGLQASVQSDAYCDFRHSKAFRDVACGMPIDAYGTYDIAVFLRQTIEDAIHVAGVDGGLLIVAFDVEFGEINCHFGTSAATAQVVDHLVARDRRDPGAKRHRLIPRMPFQMDGKQNVLHHILYVITRHTDAGKAAPNNPSQNHRQFGQEFMVSVLVARDRRAHQGRPLSVSSLSVQNSPSSSSSLLVEQTLHREENISAAAEQHISTPRRIWQGWHKLRKVTRSKKRTLGVS